MNRKLKEDMLKWPALIIQGHGWCEGLKIRKVKRPAQLFQPAPDLVGFRMYPVFLPASHLQRLGRSEFYARWQLVVLDDTLAVQLKLPGPSHPGETEHRYFWDMTPAMIRKWARVRFGTMWSDISLRFYPGTQQGFKSFHLGGNPVLKSQYLLFY